MRAGPNPVIRIGELARAAGVNVEAIRYYERRGLVAPVSRRASGYREYPRGEIARVRFIKGAQRLGFALDEIADLLRLRDSTGRGRGAVRALAVAKVADIDGRMRQLAAMRGALDALVTACECGEPTGCAIIEAMDGPVTTGERSRESRDVRIDRAERPETGSRYRPRTS